MLCATSITNLIVKLAIQKALKELEESGDIVVTTTIESSVVEKLFTAVQDISPNMLETNEFGGIMNAANATW